MILFLMALHFFVVVLHLWGVLSLGENIQRWKLFIPFFYLFEKAESNDNKDTLNDDQI